MPEEVSNTENSYSGNHHGTLTQLADNLVVEPSVLVQQCSQLPYVIETVFLLVK